MFARVATASETEKWDELVAANPDGGTYMAVKAFAAAKANYGWVARYIVFTEANELKSVALVLERKVPLLGRLWYIPRGPAALDVSAAAAQLNALKQLALRDFKSVFCITFDSATLEDDSEIYNSANSLAHTPAEFVEIGAVRQGYMQADANTVVLDLTKSEEELLAGMDKKCRNKVNRALRDEVTVFEAPVTAEYMEHMSRLQTLVGGGAANLRLRPEPYRKAYWQGYAAAGQGKFFVINGADGKPAVMSYMITVGKRAYYKDGGSERPRVTPGMSNLIVWQMALNAKAAGATEFDLVGIAPKWAKSEADHLNYTVGKFKCSFTKDRLDRLGSFELPIVAWRYKIWKKIAARVVTKLHRQKYSDIGIY